MRFVSLISLSLFINVLSISFSRDGIKKIVAIPRAKLKKARVAYDARQEIKKANVVANTGPIAEPV